MNYELALKLREMRFPHEWKESLVKSSTSLMDAELLITSYPTLSELIEACGEKLHALRKGFWKGKGNWLAYKGYWDREDNIDRPMEPVGVGSTPEEAVANLWLELNKK